MKTDKLEKFILDNRDQFDTMEPSPGLWQKIEQPQAKKIGLNWTSMLVRVAAVVVIFVSSYIFILSIQIKMVHTDKSFLHALGKYQIHTI